MSGREVAWRVLADEFLASTHDERGTSEKSPSFLISPLGARMNRVLMTGTLSPPESLGRDPSVPFLKARLTDPTGTVPVTAGSFQPRALAAMRSVTAPCRSLVVGKASLYRGRDGVAFGSVRAEALRAVTDLEYRSLLGDALSQTVQRVELAERLRSTAREGVPRSRWDGTPKAWLAGARRAVELYPSLDLRRFASALRPVLAELSSSSGGPSDPAGATPARVVRSVPTPKAAPVPPSASERAEESALLDVLDELADGSADGYADVDEAIEAAERSGVAPHRTEELLNRLEATGVLEEPIVGKVRRA